MLRRWDWRAYDTGLLMGILDLVLESMDLESMIERKCRRGGKPGRPVKLYVKILVFKEMCKLRMKALG